MPKFFSSRWSVFASLLVFFALALLQMARTSPTFDEPYAVLRGYAAIRTGYLVPIGHPPLMHWLSAGGVLLEPGLPDPKTLDGWESDNYDDSSRDLLWQRHYNATRLVFLARFPILLVGLLGLALSIRWSKQLFGKSAGGLTAWLGALSPNWLAHSGLATTDVPVSVAYLATLYLAWQWWQKPSARRAFWLGLALGLALATKFNAILLFPTLGVLLVIPSNSAKGWQLRVWREPLFWQKLSSLLVAGIAAVFAIWACYRFAIHPYPLAEYIGEWRHFLWLSGGGHNAYLLGQLSQKGWWYYHPLVLWFKTPVATLLCFGLAMLWLTLQVGRKQWQKLLPQLPLLLGSGIYLLAVLFSSLNVGYRYLLPAVLTLQIVAGNALYWQWVRRIVWGIAILQVLAVLWIAPNFLAYFNALAGGAKNGYRILADSNLDWGQDLPALASYLTQHPPTADQPLYLSYFGMADPAYYGIHALPLPAWPPPTRYDFSPAQPKPGLYAISASNLVGVQLFEPNSFGYFALQTPIAVLNHSIFIYEVPQQPVITTLAQCNPPLVQDVAELAGESVTRQLNYDCADSFLQPAQPSLTLFGEEHTPLVALEPPQYLWQRADGSTYFRLYRSQALDWGGLPLGGDVHLALLNQDVNAKRAVLGWQVLQVPPPTVSIFAHLLNPDGSLAGAYDALGVPSDLWQVGDVVWQRHRFEPAPAAGKYRLLVGLYDWQSGKRFFEIDLGEVQIP
ncbi:MAG TPA: glycosyltransferase family 39 protein [Anaerolineales bacterium]|nr:glycosyltransferase family 39 protein [Anaerolineales bacterium]